MRNRRGGREPLRRVLSTFFRATRSVVERKKTPGNKQTQAGYLRNYLLPNGIALAATDANVLKVQARLQAAHVAVEAPRSDEPPVAAIARSTITPSARTRTVTP